jgi:hypothetical protein
VLTATLPISVALLTTATIRLLFLLPGLMLAAALLSTTLLSALIHARSSVQPWCRSATWEKIDRRGRIVRHQSRRLGPWEMQPTFP